MVRKVSKKTAIGGAIGFAGISQLSRNKRIRKLGWLGLYVAIGGIIGELLGFLFKWIIWKPIKFCCKILWISNVFLYKSLWRLTVISYMILKRESMKLYKYSIIKYRTRKTVE